MDSVSVALYGNFWTQTAETLPKEEGDLAIQPCHFQVQNPYSEMGNTNYKNTGNESLEKGDFKAKKILYAML